MIIRSLNTRLSGGVSRLAARLPAGWRSTPRRRRFLFLVLCAPGFAGVAALPAHKNLAALLVGLASLGAALGFRRLSEPALRTPMPLAPAGPDPQRMTHTGENDA